MAEHPPRAARVADLFCGAGGSSTGAERALARLAYGMDLVAINHWPVAIDTHSRNHPKARHYCMDLEAAKPEALVPEGRLDLLMASPTCTFHSRARGGRPTSDQQRMEPAELARAMGFSDGESAYEFAGNKTEITRQIGNAVPVSTAAALVDAIMR